MVNNVTVSVADPTVVDDGGPSGVPLAIVVSSIVAAVVVLVGMVLFTRWVLRVGLGWRPLGQSVRKD